jgi:hypothetical protein
MAIGYIETAPIQLVFAFMGMVKFPAPYVGTGMIGMGGSSRGSFPLLPRFAMLNPTAAMACT